MKIFYIRLTACYALFFFGLMSCSSNREKESVSTSDIDDFKSYSIDPEKAPTSFFDLVEEAEVMRLEETPESLLTNVAFIGHSQGQYVLAGMSKPDIHVFTKKGELVRRINHKGEGPEEYPGFSNFWVTNGHIGLYSVGRFIIQYDLEGAFLAKEKLPISPFHAYAYEGGYALDLSQTFTEGPTHYSIMLLDSAMRLRSMMNPSKRHEVGLIGANSFADYKNTIVYHDPFSDTVFVLEDKDARPLFNLDFGSKWGWKDDADRLDRVKNREVMRNKELVWTIKPYVGPETILASYRNRTGYVWIDRKTGQYEIIDFSMANQETLGLRPVQWDGDRILCSLPSESVASMIEELGEGKVKFRQGTTLEEIESSENPVLLWVKFKELK
ncbi:6-bladed beta-propeller [Roseivirga echinicomitans]|uniref:6-bladed beta-propeller n=1 Tax=Roseivirga echinicomitans TaxID=296218 RepID=A0A150XJA8_9BACT|nr:6-bladed beta-propeller [Roseivirga echinicomitans]KYG78783.1 hypothetical protein AWN68_03910 [Roseivirga echinicomitans]